MVELSELFTNTRFPPGFKFALMVLYFPIGVFLIVCRVLIALHTYLIVCLLPKSSARRLLVRVMLGVLGIHVIVDEDKSDPNQTAKVLVSNNASILDHTIIDVLITNIVPYDDGIPALFQWVLGYKDLGSSMGKERFAQNIKAHCQASKIPVMLQPEGSSTNSNVGLLKFSSLPFELGFPVQPIAIQVSRFSFPCELTTVWSPKWVDVLWCFFSPVTVFNIKVLPLEQQLDAESAEDFAERVRCKIGQVLKLELTDFWEADKAEYVKRLKMVKMETQTVPKGAQRNGRSQPIPPSILSSIDDEMKRMIQQVRDVLPQVPWMAIKHDLDVTQDVDITLSNILEGRVIYKPEEPVDEVVEEPSTSPPRPASTSEIHMQNNSPLFKASSFSKRPYDRHFSLAERKQAMLEMARQKYKEKHGMI